jgi:hypothetical protein
MTRWEALVRLDPEIREAATVLIRFGSAWVDKLGEAFFALKEDRSYLPNIVAGLVREAEHEAAVAEREAASAWLRAFERTKEGEVTSEPALAVLLKAQSKGWQVTKDQTGIIAATQHTGTSYLWSNADIIRFGTFLKD